ncbi:MAG: stage V sporulation protein AC [Bacilli bacterium]
MDNMRYKQLVDKYTPKEKRIRNSFVAFFIGGLMGVIGQGLIDFYCFIFDISFKQAGVFMIVTLIFLGCFLTCLGFFDKWVSFAKCGLLVPITGFAHAMMSASLEYRKEGLVTGIGANMFKLAGSVIIFGVVSAYVFGLFRMLFWGC